MHELNPKNEGLTQLREYWDKIIIMLMRKQGLKEVTFDLEDFQKYLPPVRTDGKFHLYVCVLGRKHLGPHGGFTIVLADSEQEMIETMARHQGKG